MKRNSLVVTERIAALTPGGVYRAKLFSHEQTRRWIVLRFTVTGDDGQVGTVRRFFTLKPRKGLSANSELARLYAAATGRQFVAFGEEIDCMRIYGAEFSVTVGWSSKLGKRRSGENILRKKYYRDFIRVHEINFSGVCKNDPVPFGRRELSEGDDEGHGLDRLVRGVKNPDLQRFEDEYFQKGGI